MAINTADVVIGGEYITDNEQLRKVTEITQDDEGRTRVHYDCKSANFPNRPWEPCHTKANPPLLDTFANDCVRKTN